MAPELIEDASTAQPSADIYGLGATLYHMLAGKCPFSGDTMLEILEKVSHCKPPSPSELNTTVGTEYHRRRATGFNLLEVFGKTSGRSVCIGFVIGKRTAGLARTSAVVTVCRPKLVHFHPSDDGSVVSFHAASR